MTKPTVIGQTLPNIPWEDRPPQNDSIVWRSQRNPIIPHDLIPSVVGAPGFFIGMMVYQRGRAL